jgi:hypothetical protein
MLTKGKKPPVQKGSPIALARLSAPRLIAMAGSSTTSYDYQNQAWLVDGLYVTCGHAFGCKCYGKLHAGEAASE